MALKKSTGIIALIAVLVLIFLLVFPPILKSKVTTLLVEEVEGGGDYELTYRDVKISLLKDFLHLKMRVNDMALKDKEAMSLELVSFDAELSVAKVLHNELDLRSAKLFRPVLHYTILSSTDSTFEVPQKTQSHPKAEAETISEPISIFKVSELTIEDGAVFIQNEDSTMLRLQGIDYTMSGSKDRAAAAVKLALSVAEMSYQTRGLSLNKVPLQLDALLHYDVVAKLLAIGDNELKIGALKTSFQGVVKLSNQPDFDLHFTANETQLVDLISFLPKGLISDTSPLNADGELSMNGYVKGQYNGREHWPAYGLDFMVKDAWFKYQDMSEKVEGVNIVAKVEHPQGHNADATTIQIDKLAMKSGTNYFESNMAISSPVSDVSVAGQIKSELDFASLKHAIPMAATNIVGKITSDVSFDGQLSDLEQENYAAFDASGYVLLQNYFIRNAAMPQGLSIQNASLDFTPERINIKRFSGQLGTSDLRLNGYLSNYFSYLFDDKALNGVLSLRSDEINLNEFLSPESAAKATRATPNNAAASQKSKPFIVPENLNLVLRTNIAKLKADDMLFRSCQGKISLHQSRIELDDWRMHTLGGDVKVNGQYNTQKANAVFSDLHLNVKNVELSQAVKSLTILRKMLPPSQTTEGKVSSEMSYYARLDKDGEVDLQSIKSKGYLSSPGIRIANNRALENLAKQTKDARYRDITTSPVRIDYTMEKGQLTLAPFDMKVVDKSINTRGWYKLDNTLNFRIKTTVKANEIGGDVSKYVAMVSDPNKPLPVTVIITGNAQKPNIKYDTREAIKVLREDVTKSLNGDAVKSILKSFF